MDGASTPSALGTPVSLADLEAQITELAGQLNAAQYRWLLLIAARARRTRDGGVSSTSNVSAETLEAPETVADRGCATGAD
jgi:hypothetical protein